MPSHVLRKILSIKIMEQNMEQKSPKLDVKIPLDMDGLKKHSHTLVSQTSTTLTRKSASVRMDCLCSPTTHAGSFRCRHHRAGTGGMHRGGSVGSNLLELAAKASSISDSLHASNLHFK
ncbi:hypothetical protein Lalb_Chr15g0082301 [Lupinus albus]|uniref:Uncharacterized protein n=1 Tax=Lupinus albus TaxID=3870 RepID=A0A6A4P912_LUPAL|nr:hypothetical protein Lalb_Chr15g0082301 [Lupinus albus]